MTKNKHINYQKGILIDLDWNISNKFITHATNAYWHHRKKCYEYTEIENFTNDCQGKYGFIAGTLESVETLYILGMEKEYNDALKIIQKKLKCDDDIWVDRHEFWSRGIASLIGSYLLTNEEIFLKKAEECSDSLLRADRLAVKVNLKTGKGRNSKFNNGTFAYLIVSGLPELKALYNITRKEKYLDAAKSIIANLPDEGPVYARYNITTKIPFQSPCDIDSFTAPFYQTIAIAKNMSVEPDFEIDHFFGDFPIATKDDAPFVLAQQILGKSFDFYDAMLEERMKNKLVMRGQSLKGFEFEDPFVDVMRLNEDYQHAVTYILNMLDMCQKKSGYRNLKFTSSGRLIQSDNQSPSILGNWIKQGILSAAKNNRYRSIILNEHGHILHI